MTTNNQKGVSLIITFFIMLIILAVVLSVSLILYSEVKVIRNIGNSVIAFYLADSGAEKVLYYDRKVMPSTGAIRGICDICNSCGTDCDNCSVAFANGVSDGCTKCTSCHIAFTTSIVQGSSYNVVADVVPISSGQCGISQGNVESYGTYLGTTRAIKLNVTKQAGSALGPDITDKSVYFSGGHVMHIVAYISECARNMDSVTAYISNSQDSNVVTISLTGGNNGNCMSTYANTWNGGISGVTYYVSISAISNSGYCTSVTADPAQP